MLEFESVKVGFVGYGNMSGAVAKGLTRSGAIGASQIYACAGNYDNLCVKADAQGIKACRDAGEVIDACDVIFIGVKPYMVEPVMAPLASRLEGKIVISMATNMFDDELDRIMPGAHHLFTAPNTPVSVCEGIFILQKENTLTDEERVFVVELLEKIALVLWMDESHIGLGSIIAGCTPAFTSMYIEALGDAACRHGLGRSDAYKIISQMLVGTGKMALESGDHPGQMKDAVCSPGGTTIVGVNTLEKNGFRFAVIDAIDQIENKIQGKP